MTLAVVLLVLDGATSFLDWPKSYLSYVLLPLHAAVAVPYDLVGEARHYVVGMNALRREND